MRHLVIAALLSVAACSDPAAEEAAKQKAAKEAARNLAFTAGQWETTAEVTKVTKQDNAPRPAIDTPVGTKTTASVCVTAAQAKEPPAALLAAGDAYDCRYDNNYISGGSLSASLACTRKGLTGEVRMTLDGSYTADTLTANQSLSTFLSGEGDVNIVSKITARRTGECTAEPAKAG
jgi:hypothetical protein